MNNSSDEPMTWDIYAILGCAKYAEIHEIRQAYRTRAKIIHPDKNRDDPLAGQKFDQLKKAYEFINDDANREKYNNSLRAQEYIIEQRNRESEEIKLKKQRLQRGEHASLARSAHQLHLDHLHFVASQTQRFFETFINEQQFPSSAAPSPSGMANDQQRYPPPRHGAIPTPPSQSPIIIDSHLPNSIVATIQKSDGVNSASLLDETFAVSIFEVFGPILRLHKIQSGFLIVFEHEKSCDSIFRMADPQYQRQQHYSTLYRGYRIFPGRAYETLPSNRVIGPTIKVKSRESCQDQIDRNNQIYRHNHQYIDPVIDSFTQHIHRSHAMMQQHQLLVDQMMHVPHPQRIFEQLSSIHSVHTNLHSVFHGHMPSPHESLDLFHTIHASVLEPAFPNLPLQMHPGNWMNPSLGPIRSSSHEIPQNSASLSSHHHHPPHPHPPHPHSQLHRHEPHPSTLGDPNARKRKRPVIDLTGD